MTQFQIDSRFRPAGDQPKAIEALVKGLKNNRKNQTLLGVTGSGKTFTMANVIEQLQRPALVLSHNKTLAAQLYAEFKEFFPHNAVTYFVSYYDYYQPEAYIPQRDIYIEKDSSINEEIDRLRLLATSALVSRRDVIVVASVSCIYGLGSPKDYLEMMIPLRKGESIDRDELLRKLCDIQYTRNDHAPERANFRVRGDVIDVWPAYEEFAYRIELWGDEIDKLSIIHPVTSDEVRSLEEIYIYPAKHYVLPEDRVASAVAEIEKELAEQLEKFKKRENFSKLNGSMPAPGTTWNFCAKLVSAPGSKTIAEPSLAGRRASRPIRCLTSSPMISSRLSMNRMSRFRRFVRCSMAIMRAKRHWSNMASACPWPWITGLSNLMNGRLAVSRPFLYRPPLPTGN